MRTEISLELTEMKIMVQEKRDMLESMRGERNATSPRDGSTCMMSMQNMSGRGGRTYLKVLIVKVLTHASNAISSVAVRAFCRVQMDFVYGQ